ncbi:MAG: hypothetical protein J5I53_06775 [Bradyrhizobiaceae bacterium]|nr:hypothetical protein [Bradyrhizobiaceae bacterium]
MVSSRDNGGNNAVIATDGDNRICISGSYGILRSTDAYRHLYAVQTPEQADYFADFCACNVVRPGCFIAAGSYTDQVSERTMLSYDGGITWETHPDLPGLKMPGSFGMQFPGDGFGRVGFYYTNDSGKSFRHISPPDSLPQLGDLRKYRYIGQGRFIIRDNKGGIWFEADIAGDTIVQSSLPSELREVFQATDGSLVGFEQRGPRSVFRRQTSPNGTFDEIVYRDQAGALLDSIWVSKVEQIKGGPLLCYLGIRNDKLLAITGDDAWEVPLNGHIPGATQWGSIKCSNSNSFLISLAGASGNTLGMVLVDVTNRSVRVLPSHSLTSFDFDLLTDSLMIDFDDRAATIVMYDLAAERAELIGTVTDPYDRQIFVAIDKAVLLSDRPVFVDYSGDVFEVDSSLRCVLRCQAATGRSGWLENHNSTTVPAGTSLIWPDTNAIIAGGRQLQRIAPDGVRTQLRRDSTSSWLRTSWGEEFAGHRALVHRTSDSAKYETLDVPWSNSGVTSAVIGHLVECNDGALLAGLRGFRQEKNNIPMDTVEGGLWLSHDHGRSWSKVTYPVAGQMILALEKRTSDGSVWATVTDAVRGSWTETDSNGVEKEVAYVTTISNLSLIRSTDNGVTWSVVNTQSTNAAWRANISNAAFYGESTVAWAAWNGVYWSDNNGATWRQVKGLPFGKLVVSHVMFDGSGNLWISTSEGIYQVPNSASSVADDQQVTSPTFWAETFPNPSGRNITLRLHNLDYITGDISTLKIVDIVGRTVLDLREQAQGSRPSGIVDIPVDLGADAHGVYMLVAQAHNRSFTWPMCVVKE